MLFPQKEDGWPAGRFGWAPLTPPPPPPPPPPQAGWVFCVASSCQAIAFGVFSSVSSPALRVSVAFRTEKGPIAKSIRGVKADSGARRKSARTAAHAPYKSNLRPKNGQVAKKNLEVFLGRIRGRQVGNLPHAPGGLESLPHGASRGASLWSGHSVTRFRATLRRLAERDSYFVTCVRVKRCCNVAAENARNTGASSDGHENGKEEKWKNRNPVPKNCGENWKNGNLVPKKLRRDWKNSNLVPKTQPQRQAERQVLAWHGPRRHLALL
jgi:hypothetical protein